MQFCNADLILILLSFSNFIRPEAKHQEMKTYAKNTHSRVNISYSLAKKIQYKTALRLLSKNGLNDDLKVFNVKIGYIQNKVLLFIRQFLKRSIIFVSSSHISETWSHVTTKIN